MSSEMVFYRAVLGGGHIIAACCEVAVPISVEIPSSYSLAGNTLVERAGVGLNMVYGCTYSTLFGELGDSSSD